MDRFEEMQCYIAYEGIAAAGLAAAGGIALLSIPGAIVSHIRKQKDAKNRAEQASRDKADAEAKRQKTIDAFRQVYGIDASPISTSFTSKDDVVRAIYSESKQALAKIKRSPMYKQLLEKAAKDEDSDYVNDIRGIDRNIRISTGINGADTTMEVMSIELDQTTIVNMSSVCFELAKFISIRFGAYIKGNASAGDGDEGQISYVIKIPT